MIHSSLDELKKLRWVDWAELFHPIKERLQYFSLLEASIKLTGVLKLGESTGELGNRLRILRTSLMFGFGLKFEELPLHINHVDFIAKRTVQYRLEKGQ